MSAPDIFAAIFVYGVSIAFIYPFFWVAHEDEYSRSQCMRYSVFWPIYLVRWLITNAILAFKGI